MMRTIGLAIILAGANIALAIRGQGTDVNFFVPVYLVWFVLLVSGR